MAKQVKLNKENLATIMAMSKVATDVVKAVIPKNALDDIAIGNIVSNTILRKLDENSTKGDK